MAIIKKNRYSDITFKNLLKTEENSKLIEYLKEYSTDIEQKINNCENVIITGSVGVGKTFISRAFFNETKNLLVDKEIIRWEPNKGTTKEIIKDNILCRYITMFDLIQELRKEYKGEQVDETLFNCDILIIDEVGIQFGTDAERQILFKLVNYRYENYKPIFLISNHPVKSNNEVKGLYFILGERIMDRINDSQCKTFTLKGCSWRGKC